MNYCVIKTDNLTELETNVKELINKGWKPLGGICSSLRFIPTNRNCGSYYLQAMIKEDKDEV